MIGLLKQFYHEPRPYMIAPYIKTAHCSKEFGNPSGHCSASYILIAHFLDKFHGSENKFVGKRVQSSIAYFLTLGCLIIWLTIIPYSRILDGVHSIDQVVIGPVLGIWCALFMHFLVRDNLYQLLSDL